jgi:hypothetical protein
VVGGAGAGSAGRARRVAAAAAGGGAPPGGPGRARGARQLRSWAGRGRDAGAGGAGHPEPGGRRRGRRRRRRATHTCGARRGRALTGLLGGRAGDATLRLRPRQARGRALLLGGLCGGQIGQCLLDGTGRHPPLHGVLTTLATPTTADPAGAAKTRPAGTAGRAVALRDSWPRADCTRLAVKDAIVVVPIGWRKGA